MFLKSVHIDTWTTHLMDNEFNDLDEVAEKINEIIRSILPSNVAIIIVIYLNEQDYLCAVSILILETFTMIV